MDRRSVLKSAAQAATGLGLFLAARPVAGAQNGRERAAPARTGDRPAIFHRDWGEGKPIVFLHGWALCSDFWQYQMLHLTREGFRCVAFDRRGHGRSSDPGRGYDYDTLADDLAALIDQLDLRDVTLVGHSMGAGEVVRYLSRHGTGRIARTVLVGATLPFLLKTADNPAGVDRAAFDGWRRAIATDFPTWLSDNSNPFWVPASSPAMREWGRGFPFQCSLKAAFDSVQAIAETDFRSELRAIRIPTLIVHGTEDRSVAVRFARDVARLIPRSEIREYAGAPHGLPLTHMDRFNQELRAFAAG